MYPTAVIAVGALGGGDHGLGVGQRAGQRLLTQHVLTGGEQAFDDLAMQVVGDHNAHGVDVGRLGDRPPVVLGPFISIPACGVVSDGLVGVRDCHQSHVGPSVPNSVLAERYPAACARPAMPPPMTATPIDGFVTTRYSLSGLGRAALRDTLSLI